MHPPQQSSLCLLQVEESPCAMKTQCNQKCVHAELLSRVQLFVTLWIVPTRLLCPWDSPDKNTGVGCHFLLQGIFLTQRSNPRLLCLLLGRWILYHQRHLGSPTKNKISKLIF